MTRYARQRILPQVGQGGQAAIRAAHVLIVGAGGLGVPALQYLAGAGVGRITLIDPDRVDASNLHRQPIYGGHEGWPKVQAAAAFVASLNPDVTLTPLMDWLTPANARDLIAGADLVLDCADSFAASYTLSDACLAAGVSLISASALGLAGYVGGFCGGSPSLRAVFPDLPDSGATCATAGVLGPVVGMIGAMQAQMALGVLIGIDPSPLGLVMRYDMAGFRMSSFRFDAAPEPATAYAFVAASDVTPADLVIELRDTAEAPVPVAPHALRLPPEALPDPAPGQRVVFACRSGLRAWRAADRLRTHWPGQIALLADPFQPTETR